MPELAEVEYYRKQWDPGIGSRVVSVEMHPHVRVFRESTPAILGQALRGRRLVSSETHGKQMLFRFSDSRWLGIHLGMTGNLRTELPDFKSGRHDHLVLRQARQALVLADSRQFGRVLFHVGKEEPAWWAERSPSLVSPDFTLMRMISFLQRHGNLSLKAALLLQEGFPGVGNWMADEILWQTRLSPRLLCRRLTPRQLQSVWQKVRFVCRGALRTVGRDWSDPPRGWLFHERWDKTGCCPKHGEVLQRDVIGGRTTAWCRRCQG